MGATGTDLPRARLQLDGPGGTRPGIEFSFG